VVSRGQQSRQGKLEGGEKRRLIRVLFGDHELAQSFGRVAKDRHLSSETINDPVLDDGVVIAVPNFGDYELKSERTAW
jgi:hypothetical protein